MKLTVPPTDVVSTQFAYGTEASVRSSRNAAQHAMQQTGLVFKRKVIAVMDLASFINRSAPMSWQVVTPQLMRRSVRWLSSY